MFELLFKYPVSLFHKGQFVFLTPWPVWLLVLTILAAAAALFWHVRRSSGLLTGVRPVAIWILESCLVALILFLVWHPALSVATLRPQQNVVAVLVDDSKSMALNDSSGTREAAAKSVLDSGLLKGLGDRFQVRLYRFGKEPERIAGTAQLTGKEGASRIGDTLERVLAESSSLPLGAMGCSATARTTPAVSTSRPSPPSSVSASPSTPSVSARSTLIRTSKWRTPWCPPDLSPKAN